MEAKTHKEVMRLCNFVEKEKTEQKCWQLSAQTQQYQLLTSIFEKISNDQYMKNIIVNYITQKNENVFISSIEQINLHLLINLSKNSP